MGKKLKTEKKKKRKPLEPVKYARKQIQNPAVFILIEVVFHFLSYQFFTISQQLQSVNTMLYRYKKNIRITVIPTSASEFVGEDPKIVADGFK